METTMLLILAGLAILVVGALISMRWALYGADNKIEHIQNTLAQTKETVDAFEQTLKMLQTMTLWKRAALDVPHISKALGLIIESRGISAKHNVVTFRSMLDMWCAMHTPEEEDTNNSSLVV